MQGTYKKLFIFIILVVMVLLLSASFQRVIGLLVGVILLSVYMLPARNSKLLVAVSIAFIIALASPFDVRFRLYDGINPKIMRTVHELTEEESKALNDDEIFHFYRSIEYFNEPKWVFAI